MTDIYRVVRVRDQQAEMAAATAAIIAYKTGKWTDDDLREWVETHFTYYHGGTAGLAPGDLVLPPSETGAATLFMDYRQVWVTEEMALARDYAIAAGDGDVYRVRPRGLWYQPEPWFGIHASWCERAEVLEIVPRERWPGGPPTRRLYRATPEDWTPAPALVRRNGTREPPPAPVSVARVSGDGWAHCSRGHAHWGLRGAAGLLAWTRDGGGRLVVLLQQRGHGTQHGGTWGLPGGARDKFETAAGAALREAAEESTLDPAAVRPGWALTDDHGGWSYVTVTAALPEPLPVRPRGGESLAVEWVDAGRVAALPLHPGFAETWPTLAGMLVVEA